MRITDPMTHSVETDPEARWAIEVEREGLDGSSEFYSVSALEAGPDGIQITTAGGTQVSFPFKGVRKLLVMRAKEVTAT